MFDIFLCVVFESEGREINGTATIIEGDVPAPVCCQHRELKICYGSDPVKANKLCNDYCISSCRGGECKIREGKHVCHCYC